MMIYKRVKSTKAKVALILSRHAVRDNFTVKVKTPNGAGCVAIYRDGSERASCGNDQSYWLSK